MNREEAIEALTRIKWVYVGNELFEAEKEQAIDIAIEALQTPPISQRSMYQAGYRQGREEALKQVTGKLNNSDDSLFTADPEDCKEQKSKLDLISRQEAIKAIEIVDWYHQNQNKEMVSGANDYEHQAWYKAQDIYKALEAVPSANRPKDGDLISRAEAIEALGEEPPVWCDEEYEIAERNQWGEDVETIKSVPSADRPRGEWIKATESVWECSLCKGIMFVESNYCPFCGADMRATDGEKSEEHI